MRLFLQIRAAGLAALLLALIPTFAMANEVPTRFFDGAAREMASHLEAGNGWAVVSERQMVDVLGQPAEALRYRVVTGFTKGTTSNGQFFVEVVYGLETPPIFTALKLPTVSGPSLTLAKQANEAISSIDALIVQLEAGIAAEENAELRNLGNQLLGAYRTQRTALIDLIQKDIAAIR
jgi:hypothetical protein